MTWWLWIVLGIFLLLGEMTTPGGLFLLFFGFGGILTGLLTWTGLIGAESVQWLIFTIISIGMLLLFRSRLRQILGGHTAHKDVDSLVGQVAIAISHIGINEVGQVEQRGANWSAKNIGNRPISISDRCMVERVDGLTLLVKGE